VNSDDSQAPSSIDPGPSVPTSSIQLIVTPPSPPPILPPPRPPRSDLLAPPSRLSQQPGNVPAPKQTKPLGSSSQQLDDVPLHLPPKPSKLPVPPSQQLDDVPPPLPPKPPELLVRPPLPPKPPGLLVRPPHPLSPGYQGPPRRMLLCVHFILPLCPFWWEVSHFGPQEMISGFLAEAATLAKHDAP
jgi:hypothetical protein